MKKRALLFTTTLLLIIKGYTQTPTGLGINATGADPDSSAILDVASTTKGMLIPRMTQAQRNVITPAAEGLIVYQTDGTEGFYYRHGSGWYRIGSDVTEWSLQGNAGTNPGVNFIGTTDNVALRFKTNSIDRMTILQGGNVGVGTTNPGTPLEVNGTITARNDNGIAIQTGSSGKIRVGSNGFDYKSEIYQNSNSIIYEAFGDVDYNNLMDRGGDHKFRVNERPQGGGIIPHDAMIINRYGMVGIGTMTPTAPLQVKAVGTGTPTSNGLYVFNPTSGENASICARVAASATPGKPYFSLDIENAGGWSMGMNANKSLIFSNSWDFNLTSPNPKMTILTSGWVGIGTTDPKAPLHVIPSTTSSPFSTSSGSNYTKIIPASVTSNQTGPLSGPNVLVSLIAEGDIIGKGTITVANNLFYSDARIKNISGLSNSSSDLALLEQIKVTDYTMKDRVTWGQARYKKVIAQDVEAVYPQAVKKTTGYLPDVYDFAAKVEKTAAGYLVTMAKPMNCAKSNKVRLELENKGTVEAGVTRVVNDRQFEVASDADLATGTLFVYGMQVDDLRTVDYDALSMLNVSATQELARQLKAAQAKIDALEKENTDMKAAIGEIRSYLNIASRK